MLPISYLINTATTRQRHGNEIRLYRAITERRANQLSAKFCENIYKILLNPKYFTIFAPCFYETQRHIAQSSLNHHLRNELIIKIGTAPYGRRLPVFDDGLW